MWGFFQGSFWEAGFMSVLLRVLTGPLKSFMRGLGFRGLRLCSG